jgi:hypothetical protein
MMVICGIDKRVMQDLEKMRRPNEDIDQVIMRCIDAYKKIHPDVNVRSNRIRKP